jgi:hypothetical protein
VIPTVGVDAERRAEIDTQVAAKRAGSKDAPRAT